MLTINSIVKEIKDVPVNRLEELYQFIHSLTPSSVHPKLNVRKKILSFGGVFRDLSKTDYDDYLNQTKLTRNKLFDRNIEI